MQGGSGRRDERKRQFLINLWVQHWEKSVCLESPLPISSFQSSNGEWARNHVMRRHTWVPRSNGEVMGKVEPGSGRVTTSLLTRFVGFVPSLWPLWLQAGRATSDRADASK